MASEQWLIMAHSNESLLIAIVNDGSKCLVMENNSLMRTVSRNLGRQPPTAQGNRTCRKTASNYPFATGRIRIFCCKFSNVFAITGPRVNGKLEESCQHCLVCDLFLLSGVCFLFLSPFGFPHACHPHVTLYLVFWLRRETPRPSIETLSASLEFAQHFLKQSSIFTFTNSL